MKKRIGLSLAILYLSAMVCSAQKGAWSLILKRRGQPDLLVTRLPADLTRPFLIRTDTMHIQIQFTLEPRPGFTVFKATACTSGADSVYFSLEDHYAAEEPWNFNGAVTTSEVFRQSPHDVNAWVTEKIAKQAIPVVALRSAVGFAVALNGSPALYKNFTSQAFYTDKKTVSLSSGDDGATPGLKPDTGLLHKDYNTEKGQVMAPGKIISYYHAIAPGKAHHFEGLLFTSHAQTLAALRQDINRQAAVYFSGGRIHDTFGTLAFTTAYMNLRVNETGKSQFWVVPSVEYANTQYCRDAFWISTMLSPEMAGECLKSELAKVNTYAEYPLMTILWAYRTYTAHRPLQLQQVQAYVDSVEARAKDGYFYSYTEQDGRQDFQYWGDLIAFDKDDVVTYNQGLFALAMQCAQKMGLRTKTNPAKALANYRNLFNGQDGFYPLSKKKNTLFGPDVLVPDLLARIYFDKPLLPADKVKKHYEAVIGRLKTANGFKMVGQRDGAYLRNDQYDAGTYRSQANKETFTDGQYIRGGSYLLYDALFLLDAYMQGIPGAEDELIARVSLDFEKGGTTYECLNTVTGEPWKPNMGWNIAIYYYWRLLMDRGKANDRLFLHLDQLSSPVKF